MVLPGVPRTQRIQFVRKLVELLLTEGLDEITESEFNDLNDLMRDLLAKIEPAAEPSSEDTEPSSGGC